jgi:hypothetical protein
VVYTCDSSCGAGVEGISRRTVIGLGTNVRPCLKNNPKQKQLGRGMAQVVEYLLFRLKALS